MRHRRWLLAAGALALAVFAGVVAFVCIDQWELWFAPELARAADASGAEVRLVAAKNVHVSAVRPGLLHQGCTIAAEASTPARLFAASMVTPQGRLPGIAGYFSDDGGETWQLGLERLGRNADDVSCDEALAFSPDGDLLMAYMRGPFKKLTLDENPKAETVLLVSADGGKTWQERAAINGLVDRPQLAIDTTAGPFRGRLYCNANILAERRNVAVVYASADGARAMLPAGLPSHMLLTIYNSNPVVLADGTVMVAYHKLGENASRSARFPVWRSTDGGSSFASVSPVRTVWRHPRAHSQSSTTLYPRLAADSTTSALAGRLYCVWSDGPFVLFSYSADRGDTWSDPVLLSEQSLLSDGNDDY
jgi:hypothetical protein